MALLSREQILAKQGDLPTKDVGVPEWGGSIRVRCLTAAERLQFGRAQAAAAGDTKEGPDPSGLLIALGAVDESGHRLYQVQDSDALAGLRGDVVERITDEIIKLSGMAEDAKQDAEGNSDATPSGDSSSASPVTSGGPSPS